jgi:sigma-B regulation protein RsbU (phosphoserine phosphatase)
VDRIAAVAAARSRRSRTYLLYAALTLLFATAVMFHSRDMVERFQLFSSLQHARSPIFVAPVGNRIESVKPEAESSGIRVGHFLVSVNGHPFKGLSDLYAPLRNARAGDVMILGTTASAQGTEEKTNSVRLTSERLAAGGAKQTATDWLLFFAFNVGVPLVCIALGFFVAAVRPFDPQAWMLLLLLLGFLQHGVRLPVPAFGYDDAFQPIGLIYSQMMGTTWPVAMTLFGIYFGERLYIDRKYPWAKWFVIAPLLFAATIISLAVLLSAHDWRASAAIQTKLAPFGWPLSILFILGVALFFVGTGYKAITAVSHDARRRARLLWVGACLSLAPIVVVLSLLDFEEIPPWLLSAVLAMLFLFPATLAYVIVVEKALDVRVVIRQGVQYLLASGSVRVLQILLSVMVIVAAVFLATDEVKKPQRFMMIVLGLMGVAVIQRTATKLRRWIDRRFFREAYDADRILTDLADQVRTFVETPPLLNTVAKRISESLHVPRVALLTRSASAFQPAYVLGYPEPPQVQISEDSAVIERLRQEGHARVYLEDQSSWVYQSDVAEQEQRALRALDAQLLLPLSLNQKLLGILSLGPKQSEEPFSKGDLRLLNAVATQTGLALENSRLVSAIAAEVAQRERMNRELEIAREVQERLFPQELPAIDGLDYAGRCRPALGVGGDYYDFIQVSPTALGFAIGDVSGKGVPAALLMAALRASLRGQTIRREADLAHLMATVNQLLYEGSTANRYATFFYGEYESTTRCLTYVNAGHNPPMVFRTASNVIRLETGGPAVGLMPGCSYQQATIQLQAGDRFLAFTDGIVEALNANEEEWGEDRLISCALKLTGCAEHGLTQIMTAADEFVAGATQYDDMTIVLAYLT